MSSFLSKLGGVVMACCVGLSATVTHGADAKPNIIFILCDDLGYGDLGVLFQNSRPPGQPRMSTPNLDQFAAEGAQLRQYYCPAPVCAPSRASLLLGVHQGHSNVRDNQFDKELENNHTLGTVMQKAGYATAAIGKWGLQGKGKEPGSWPAYPTKRGFDYYFGYVRHVDGHEHYPKEGLHSGKSVECYDGNENITPKLDKCYTTDLFTARTKKWIEEQHKSDGKRPFFLYLAYDTPHNVLELPTQAYPAGKGARGGVQWLGTPGHMINTASGTVDSYIYPEYVSATYDHDQNPATAMVPWPEEFKRYACSVRRIDEAVGDIKQLLADLGIDKNTLVIFTSDNGPASFENRKKASFTADFFASFGPMDGIKRDTWEGGIRMAALARWPGQIKAGTLVQTPGQAQDWMATFAQLAGLPAPAHSDGVSLVPSLTGKGKQRESTVYVEYFHPGSTPEFTAFEPGRRGRKRGQMQVVRVGRYQGVRFNVTAHSDDFEIYDVVSDPKQTRNLALRADFAPLQRQMKDRVLQLRRPDADASRPYDEEYVPAVALSKATEGKLKYQVYAGEWPWVPDFSAMAATSTGQTAGVQLPSESLPDKFGVAYQGYFKAAKDGDYTFYLSSDAGAHLRLHDACVIDDDYRHTGEEVSGTIRLKAGWHPVRLYYRHSTGPKTLKLEYSGPESIRQAVPSSAFAFK